MVKTLGVACVVGVAAFIGTGVRPLQAGAQQQVAPQIIDADGQPRSLEAFAAGVLTKDAPGLVLPKLVKNVHPTYTPSAMREKVQGEVRMFAIVDTDGKVIKSEVVQSLHPELDQRALDALSQWKFSPGRRNGTPVRVAIEVQMAFRLHKS